MRLRDIPRAVARLRANASANAASSSSPSSVSRAITAPTSSSACSRRASQRPRSRVDFAPRARHSIALLYAAVNGVTCPTSRLRQGGSGRVAPVDPLARGNSHARCGRVRPERHGRDRPRALSGLNRTGWRTRTIWRIPGLRHDPSSSTRPLYNATPIRPYSPHPSPFASPVALRLLVHPLTLRGQHRLVHAEHPLDLLLDLRHHRRVVLQEQLRVLATLADPLAVVAVPRPGLLDDPALRADVHQQRGVRNPLGVHDVELRLLERRRHLVLHHLHPNVRTDHVLLLLHRADATNVESQ